jgi:predicted nucleic acid-binding protein
MDRPVVEGAWKIQDRYGLAFWDGMIVSASLMVGCRYLLSGDFQAGQILDGIEVVDPFVCSPADLD